ncbi:MAG TPA: anthranilate phosphoribosyltransferase [Candidatus Avipropionibacterium avicola]|uniref:Anthranilate phosphoribosyltransferase n=1 Tax=Candidatus Avipropionibacterium avicola TaxID=2840701 RepID=A0A9D1GY35_9ACTN|nr:anthranilate phosphoribosyltransferase [Candidatus Avipropionibacterium avicola]
MSNPVSEAVPKPYEWRSLIGELTARRDLDAEATNWVGAEIVTGAAHPIAVAGFLAALRTKGETTEELHGMVRALLDHGRAVGAPDDAVDIVGTGGDGSGLMNVSTLAGIVAAGAGLRVVKHGGRAASSRTAGSADLAEGLGLPLDLNPTEAERRIVRHRFAYLFAPQFNPGLRHAVDARRHLGVPTVFNLAAPLLNPARPRRMVIGVADRTKAPLVAEVMARLGRTGVVVSGGDGLDKASTTLPSDLWLVRATGVTEVQLDPTALGITAPRLAELRGGDVRTNVAIARAVLAGRPGPRRDIVVLNAALLLCAQTLDPDRLIAQLGDAMARAEAAIDSGAATAVLETATRVVS